jgi:sugar lactone lactonase YvrE
MEDIEIISKQTEILGEGPTWDRRNNKVYWVDIKGHHFRSFELSTGKIETVKTDGMVSSLVPSRSGKMYATIGHRFTSIDPSTGKEKVLMETETSLENNRFNDGKVDPYGNYWAGTMDMNEKEPVASLYVYTKSGELRKVLGGQTISNGLAWDVNRMLFYHIDTPTRKVRSYTYNDKCELTNERIAVDFTTEVGFPDGMNIDTEGMIWVAHWGGHRISRWNPSTGKKLSEIIFPATNVTSCTFGGKNMTELFVSSAKLTSNQPADPKDIGGSIFRVDTGIKGVETYYYDDSKQKL